MQVLWRKDCWSIYFKIVKFISIISSFIGMIILIESDKNKRKELGDLLPKERILTFGSTQDVLEQIAKYKNEINIIIANLPYLYTIASDQNQTMQKLCDKLCIKIPPLIGYYGKKEEKHPIFKKALEKCENYELVKYDKKDKEFPAKFIEAIRKEYRDLNVDLKKAKRIWSGEEEQFEDLSDIKKLLEEEGFSIEEPKEIYLEEIKEKHKKGIEEYVKQEEKEKI